MSDFQKGDLVEAVKGEVRVTDRLADSAFEPGRCYLPTMRQQTYVDALEARGWTLTLLDRPKPKVELPTEPGLYRLSNKMVVEFTGRDWVSPNHMHYVADHAEQSESFTKLEPVPVTADRVLDRLKEVWRTSSRSTFDDIEQVRSEFGVTD